MSDDRETEPEMIDAKVVSETVDPLFADIADMTDACAAPVERVSPEHAAKLRTAADNFRGVGQEVARVKEAGARVSDRLAELSAWAKRVRPNPMFARRFGSRNA